MPVKTPDGLAHVPIRHEDEGHWGRTVCNIQYTRDPKAIEALQRFDDTGVVVVTFVKPPITCLVCFAGGYST